MAKLVNLPNGSQGSFPDDMSWEDIESVVQKQFPVEQPSKKSLFDFDKKQAEQDFSKLSGQVLRESPYVAQGAINEPGKMANVLLPKNMQIPKLNVANKLSPGVSPESAKADEGFGGMLGMGLPRAGVMGGLKALQGLPSIGKVLEHAMKASPILNKLFDVGGRGAEFGLYEAAEHPEQSGTRGALGFGLGAGLSALGHGVPAVANKLGFGKQPGEEAIEGLTYGQVAPAVEASERLGTPLRPSEASGNPFLAGLEGKYPRTREAAFENVELGMERVGQEKSAINKLLNTIYDKSTAANNKVRDLYQSAYRWNMKPEVVNQLKQDPLISEAFDTVSKDKAWQRKIQGAPESNFAYLDKVRKALGDEESKLIRSGEKSKAKEYTEARNNLSNVMDNASPAYKQARAEAQKSIIRSQLEKKLKTGEIKGTEFYKKIIKNETKFDDLVRSLDKVPEAQSMLKDMKTAWHSLINVEKPSSASYQSEKALNQARNYLDRTIELWNKLTGKKKNAEAVKFIRSDAWVKKLKEAQNTGKKENVDTAVNDIMMKVLPVGDFLLEENK